MTVNKTVPTSVSVDDFLANVESNRAIEAREIITMMREISGHEPVMWGPSIIGFGSYHYVYESGRKGDMPAVAFSPRKSQLTIYITEGFDKYGDLLSQLGTYTTSVSCLYIRKLADVDKNVLRAMIARSYENLKRSAPGSLASSDIEVYFSAQPEKQRMALEQIRTAVTELAPQAEQKMSYGLPAFYFGPRRWLYYGAWKDHMSVYPIPKDSVLADDLKPYIKGKGTLWFSFDTPLPIELILRIAKYWRDI